MKFGQRPCTIVQGLWPDFLATLKIHKKFNFDRNQLKVDKQHKNMYMYLIMQCKCICSCNYNETAYTYFSEFDAIRKNLPN